VFLHVKSAGYEGSNELFVMREEFVRFCMSLRQLEQTPRGEARWAAMFPNELELVMRAANSRGGLEVRGTTGYHPQGREHSYWHSVSIGFEFEPQWPTSAVDVSWVRSAGQPCDQPGLRAADEPSTVGRRPIDAEIGCSG
jgi:hypothetical protein